jgi:branched-chain amino acid transport system permease protein
VNDRYRNFWPLILFAGLALVPLLATFGVSSYWISLVTRGMIFAIAALSLDLILGMGGLVSFGHAAFLGIGAYAAGIAITDGYGDLFLALPLALIAAAIFAAVTGAISLRTRGVAFIMITLAFGQMTFFMAQSLYAYGGDDGLTLTARSTILGFAVLENRLAFFYIVLTTLILVFLLTRALVASRFGRVLRASRENPVRLAVLGFDVRIVQVGAYVVSGMICAIAGFLLANHTEFVSPAFISWQRSGELIFMVILGGVGTLHGAITGALVFLLLEEQLSAITKHWKIIFGPMIILFVIFTRGGLAGVFGKWMNRS